MIENKKPTSAREYWTMRRAQEADRKARGIRTYPGLNPQQQVRAIRTHVCGPECGIVCTKFEW